MNFLKSAASKVKSTVSKAVSGLGSLLSGGKNTASASSALNFNNPTNNALQAGRTANMTMVPNMTVAPNPSAGERGGAGTGGVSANNNFFFNQGTQSAVRNLSGGSTSAPSSPIYSAPVNISGGGSRTSGGTASGTSMSGFGPTTLTSSPNNFSNFNTLSSQSFAPSSAISIPSAPPVSNPGVINNGGLVGALADSAQFDPNTNTFAPKELQVDSGLEGRQFIEKMLQDMIPREESVFDDPDVRNQQMEVNRRKQEVANYTAQLNSVVAQQNADLLRLREIGSKEGVTETVYGGQQATINREAAIKALPIQAQIAAAQGNLELAQDYLTQLTTWKREDLDNQYNYKKEVYNSIRNFVDKEQSLQLKKAEKQEERAYREAQDLISEQDYWVREAVKNGQASLIPRINNTRSRQELANVISAIVPKSSGPGSSTGVELSADKQRVLLGAGLNLNQINQIEKDINQYGMDSVLAGLSSESQKKAVREVYGATSSEQFLNQDYINRAFSGVTLDAKLKAMGKTRDEYRKLLQSSGKEEQKIEQDYQAYLQTLMPIIEMYREAGFSDKEILKMMQ